MAKGTRVSDETGEKEPTSARGSSGVQRPGPEDVPPTVGQGWTPKQAQLLNLWWRRAEVAQHAHFYLAARLRTRNLWLGIPTVVLTTIVGTSAFASLTDSDEIISREVIFLVGVVSVLAAVLAATQTFLRFAERAQMHASAADWYAAIKRKIEQYLVFPPTESIELENGIREIRENLNHAGQTYPAIGEKVWHDIAGQADLKEPDHLKVWEAGVRRRSSGTAR